MVLHQSKINRLRPHLLLFGLGMALTTFSYATTGGTIPFTQENIMSLKEKIFVIWKGNSISQWEFI